MFLVAAIIIVPSIFALTAQYICYLQYIDGKFPLSAKYATA